MKNSSLLTGLVEVDGDVDVLVDHNWSFAVHLTAAGVYWCILSTVDRGWSNLSLLLCDIDEDDGDDEDDVDKGDGDDADLFSFRKTYRIEPSSSASVKIGRKYCLAGK